MSQITTHILDTSTGTPAANIPLHLSKRVDGQWLDIASGISDQDGRVGDLIDDGCVLDAGDYKLFFDTAHYFTSLGKPGFYPWVEVVFSIAGDGRHYHIPLLLSPFGYSTYRGS